MLLRRIVLPSLAAAALVVAAACSGDGDDDNAVRPDASEAGDAAADSADTGPVAKGDRAFGIVVAADNQMFDDGLETAMATHATIDDVTLAWDDVETQADAGTGMDAGTELFNPLVHIVNLELSTYNIQGVYALSAIDASGSRAPFDLKTTALDDPSFESRYDAFVDYVLNSTEDTDVPALLVGTEVDVALGDDTAKYAAFASFVTHAAAHVHAARPKTKVGFSVRAANLSANAARLTAAWAASDLVAVSLLPGLADAHAGAPEDVGAAFDAIVAAAPGDKPIWIHEAGSPTDPAAFGSEASQAAFVSAVFAAWDKHASRIPAIVFRELTDEQTAVATAAAARYGRTDAAFIAYLASLGLQSSTQQPKPGFAALKQEASARGF